VLISYLVFGPLSGPTSTLYLVIAKLLLISVVVASLLIPLWAAREESPRRGAQKAILFVVVFNFIYMLALRFIYPRL
jgi:hypothetical protein